MISIGLLHSRCVCSTDAETYHRLRISTRPEKSESKPVDTSKNACFVRSSDGAHPMTRDQTETLFVRASRQKRKERVLEVEIYQFISAYESFFAGDDFLQGTDRF
jgi:hypothetical protein